MKSFFLKIAQDTQAGFSLVETLVSLAILMTAVLGPMSIAQTGIQGARIASQNITAIFLAQEAIELVKAQVYSAETNGDGSKDSSNPNYWLKDVKMCEGGTACAVDASPGASSQIQNCSSTCPPLYISGDGFYTTQATNASGAAGSSVNEKTPYVRQVAITGNGTDDWRKITVTVQWYQPDGVTLRGTYTADDWLYKSSAM